MNQILYTQPIAPIVNNLQHIQQTNFNPNQQLIIGLSKIGYIQNTNTNIYQLQCVPLLQQTPPTVICPPSVPNRSVPVTVSDFHPTTSKIQYTNRNHNNTMLPINHNINIPTKIRNLINTISNTQSKPFHKNGNAFRESSPNITHSIKNTSVHHIHKHKENIANKTAKITASKPIKIIKHEPLQSIQKQKMRFISDNHSEARSTTTNATNSISNSTTNTNTNALLDYECKHCNKTFLRKSNLICHQKVHGPNPHTCPFCGKKFARNCNLQQHIRVHTGEKPFRCKLCNKSFKQQHSLKYHTRLHLGEYPYQCKYCAKRFAAKCNCIVHIRTHTGEKPYECSHCTKKYASKSGLNSHCQ
eukprot:284713_1